MLSFWHVYWLGDKGLSKRTIGVFWKREEEKPVGNAASFIPYNRQYLSDYWIIPEKGIVILIYCLEIIDFLQFIPIFTNIFEASHSQQPPISFKSFEKSIFWYVIWWL